MADAPVRNSALKRIIAALVLILAAGAAGVVWFNRQQFIVHAARRGDARILRGLLALGADPDGGPGGTTPLYAAVWHRQGATAACLLAHGADVNALSGSGFTALHAAASHGDEAMVRLLLDHGADITARAPCGSTALDLAGANRHEGTVALLAIANASPAGKAVR